MDYPRFPYLLLLWLTEFLLYLAQLSVQVCKLLEQVCESALPRPETLTAVEQLMKQQEIAVAQLDAQRGNVVSMLQQGKDLSRDKAAPEFVRVQVRNLETEWNQAYNTSLEKLNQLKGMEQSQLLENL